MTDIELLHDFSTTRSDATFAMLVDRHVDMVYTACLWRLRDPAASQDATQAVFVALSKKAGVINPGVVLSAWLYKAATYEAMLIRRRDANRKKHEMAAAKLRPESGGGIQKASHSADADIVKALDCLRSQERNAIVLRYLQNRSLAEVAAEIRITEEAARKRIARGLEKLRGLLGVPNSKEAALSSPTVTGLLMSSVYSAPATVKAAAVKASTSGQVCYTTSVLGKPSFFKGVISLMTAAKTTSLALIVALLLLGSGALMISRLMGGKTIQGTDASPGTNALVTTGFTTDWKDRFDQAYSLKPEEILRNIPVAGKDPDRKDIFDDYFATHRSERPLDDDDEHLVDIRYVFGWIDDQADSHIRRGDWNLGELAKAINIPVQNLDHRSIPLETPMPGDWVYRMGASEQQKMDALSATLSERLSHQVNFEQRDEPRDTIVVTGHFQFTPLEGEPDDGIIDMAEQPWSEQKFNRAATVTTTVSGMLKTVAELANTRVSDETAASNDKVYLRRIYTSSPPKMIDQLARCTGLTFKHELRPTKIWILVDSTKK